VNEARKKTTRTSNKSDEAISEFTKQGTGSQTVTRNVAKESLKGEPLVALEQLQLGRLYWILLLALITKDLVAFVIIKLLSQIAHVHQTIEEAKPMVSTFAGGILAYLIVFGLPPILSFEFRLRMTSSWFAAAFVVLLGLFGSFLIVFVHWTLARYCEHRLSQMFYIIGAMAFPALMFAVWT
jgi:hypothetical protein